MKQTLTAEEQTMDLEARAQIAEGIGCLMRLLGTIGNGKTDHDLAQVVGEGEIKIRAVLDYAIKQMANGC